MDEVQAMIEDAQFMSAIYDETPRPSAKWKMPSQSEVSAYVTRISESDPFLFELEGICANPLGFYLYVKYLTDMNEKPYATFLQQVAFFRKAPPFHRSLVAKSIAKDYFSFGSTGAAPMMYPDSLTRSAAFPETITYTDYLDIQDINNALCLKSAFAEALTAQANAEGSPSDFIFDSVEAAVFAFMKEKHLEGFKTSSHYEKYLQFMTISTQPVTDNDFSLFRVLGRGGFGVVNGCKRRQTGKLYAMKVMEKKRIKLKKAESLVINERNVLLMMDSKFVVCLKYAFGTPRELFLVVDLMVGGDLGFHLHCKGRFSQTEAKYYISRTVLGLKALHDVNVVYRDLKPDNILMDAMGRTRLSDLGLAVRVPKNGLTGACGTRGYWAPEMLRRDAAGNRIRYNLSVDWFSLGCVLYEFIYGICPFRTDTAKRWGGADLQVENAIDLAIQEMEPYFDMKTFDEVTKDFCMRLMEKDPEVRLGANGADEVMNHPYFSDVNWEEVKYEKHPAPFIPRRDINVASQNEIGSFEDEAEKSVRLVPEDDVYKDWAYVNAGAFLEEVVHLLKYEDIMGPIPIQYPTTGCCLLL